MVFGFRVYLFVNFKFLRANML